MSMLLHRRSLLLGTGSLLLAGCGGGDGGSEPPGSGPTILDFGAAAPAHFVGERAQLTARFRGGTGRIEPDIGAVQNGVPVPTPVLDRDRRFTLIVEAPGQAPLRRELLLQVGWRDRYVPLAMSFPLQYHAAAEAADGSVIVTGGSRSGLVLSDGIERFDPQTRAFTRIGQLRTGRSGHTATRLEGGRILVLGGQVSLDIGPLADLVDEGSGAVADGGRLQLPRSRHAAVALADGRVLVVGGLNRDSVELWDPQARRFRLLAARLQHVREFPSATLLADGRVLIAGGWHGGQSYRFAELFDPRTERFEPVPDEISERRLMHQAWRQADGSVLIVGGELVDETQERILPLASVLRFDPGSGRFTPEPPLDQPRSLVRGVQLPDGRLLIFGGSGAELQPLSSATAYRAGSTGAALAPMPHGRAWHTVSQLGDGRVLILGGDDAGGQPVLTGYLYE